MPLTPRSHLLKLAGIALSVLLLSVTGFLPYVDAQTQTKYLSYENKQYGFSIKYPSNWEKTENPNSDVIVSFAPSQNTAYAVSFSANDQSIKGLNGEQILAALKKQVTDTCSAAASKGVTCSDITANRDTHKNGYAIYAVYYTASGTSEQGTTNVAEMTAIIPDGNDVWMLQLVSYLPTELEQFMEDIGSSLDSFTIFDYQGEQTTSQSSTIAKSNVGTLQINSGHFTASKYLPAELIVSGEINNYLQGVPLTITIVKPDKTSEEQNILVTKDGNFRAPIKIEGTWPAGSYQLSAKYGTQDLGTVSFSVNMGSGATTPSIQQQTTPTPKTTKILSYDNKQYGFSIKYPSYLQKEETLEKDDTIPNMLNIVTFNTSSELTYASVNLIQDDTIYRGLSGQKFLDKMKSEFERVFCSSAAESGGTCSMEVIFDESFTHKNGYPGYRAAYGLTLSDGQDSVDVLVAVTMIPDSNDVWMIVAGSFSMDEIKSIGKELDQMTDSFTISDYEGEKKQFSLQSKAAQENDIVYLVVRNPEDSSDDIYSIKLTNVNGKITNFIKIKDWTYKRVGPDSIMYQTTT
ncbi:hypothetical protein HYV87_04700, partial [Candidatus Woesearchaeota archaeon]|nr:hypothetical protein [Candidatus Woesearchaeota archaeon]